MLAQFVLFDGFDPLDVIAPYEILAAAALVGETAPIAVELVSAEGPRIVPSGQPGISLAAAAVLDPARADLVVVPGAVGALPRDEMDDEQAQAAIPAILARTLETPLPGLLAAALAAEDTIVATVCGGSLIPAMAGLLEGRHATTHHLGLDVLAATGAVVTDGRLVDDGDLISCGSVTSGLDLGLYLLEREVGPRIAVAVERLVAHERRGVVWRAAGPEPLTV
jgi:transcriptional regulator GlxA family with amidase domain